MSTSSPTGWGTYLRDSILFAFGIAIVMKQAGMFFTPPEGGVSIPLIIVGALFCNGPLMLQAMALRFGTGSSSPPGPPPEPRSLSAPSSGGE